MILELFQPVWSINTLDDFFRYFRMQTEKENYFRDLEDVIQHLKKEVIREEDLNAKVSSSPLITNDVFNKMYEYMYHLCISFNIISWQLLQWDLIAKEEGLGCIIFNEENEQSVESESGNKHLIVQNFVLKSSIKYLVSISSIIWF